MASVKSMSSQKSCFACRSNVKSLPKLLVVALPHPTLLGVSDDSLQMTLKDRQTKLNNFSLTDNIVKEEN